MVNPNEGTPFSTLEEATDFDGTDQIVVQPTGDVRPQRMALSVLHQSPEDVRDILEAALVGGENVTIDFDDHANTITISARLEAGGGLVAHTDEEIRDLVAGFLVQGANVTLTHDDAADTLTVAAANRTNEEIRDIIAATVVAGTHTTVTVDDDNDTVAISAHQRSDEEIRDVVAAFLREGTNVTLTHDDANDTLTITATGSMGGLDQAAVDARIRALVEDWAEVGGPGIPTSELPNIPDTPNAPSGDGRYELLITSGAATWAAAQTAGEVTQRTDEEIRDVVGATLVEGANVSITVDDDNETITIASSFTDTQRSDEEIRDVVGAMANDSTTIEMLIPDATDVIEARLKDEAVRTHHMDTTGDAAAAGKLLAVSTTNTDFFSFIDAPETGPDNFTDLDDTPASLGTAGQVVAVDTAGTGLEFVDAPSDGADGQGVPAGGTSGQVLSKATDTDYDTRWINAAEGGGEITARTDEEIRDVIGAALVQGANVTITVDDDNDTITIAAADTDTNTQRSDEEIRDVVAAFITQGANVTVTHDDSGDTLTIAASDTNTQRSDEDIRDVIATFIRQGNNVTVTHDDAGDTLTIASTDTDSLVRLTDTPATFGTAGQMLVVNTAADGTTWADQPTGGIGASTLIALTDTPNSFGTAGQVLAVASGATGTEWVDQSSGGGEGVPATNPDPESVTLTTVTIPHQASGTTEAGTHSATVGDIITTYTATSVTIKAGQYEVEMEAAATNVNYRAAPVMRITRDDDGGSTVLARTTSDYFRDDSDLLDHIKQKTSLYLAADTAVRFAFHHMQYEIDSNLGQGAGGAITLTTPKITFYATHGTKGDQGDAGEGVPAGGTDGQVLAKSADTDYATEWIDAATGSASAFTDLSDTPTALGTAGQIVRVATGGAALEFADASSAGLDAEGVRDAVGAALVEGTGIDITVDDANDTITIASTVTDTNTDTFTGLTDTPNSFGTAGQIPAVNAGATGLEFIDAPSDGADGQGVPAGGTSGQVLSKATGADYDTTWVDATSDGGSVTARTDEEIRDVIGAALSDSSRITFTVDDDNDSITADIADDSVGSSQMAANAVGASHLDLEAGPPGAADVGKALVLYDNTGDGQLDWKSLLPDAPSGDGTYDLTVSSGTPSWATATDTDTFLGLTDTPSSFGTAGQVAQINAAGDSLEWANQSGGLDAEGVRDTIGAALVGGANVTITVDDANETITIAASDTDTNTQRTDEEIRDVVAGFVVGGSNVTITHDDAGDTLTFAATDTNTFVALTDTPTGFGTAGQLLATNAAGTGLEWTDRPSDGADGNDGQGVPTGGTSGQVLAKATGADYDTTWVDATSDGGAVTARTDEEIRDVIGAALVQGAGITVTVDDDNDSITIASTVTDTNTQRTDEEIRDLIAGFITEGSNVTVTHDDAGDTLTIAATDTNTQRTDQEIIDVVVGLPGAGVGTTASTLSSGGQNTGFAINVSPEYIRDTVAAALVEGTNVTITHDDANDNITISAAGSASTDQIVKDTLMVSAERNNPRKETNEADSIANSATSSIFAIGNGNALSGPAITGMKAIEGVSLRLDYGGSTTLSNDGVILDIFEDTTRLGSVYFDTTANSGTTVSDEQWTYSTDIQTSIVNAHAHFTLRDADDTAVDELPWLTGGVLTLRLRENGTATDTCTVGVVTVRFVRAEADFVAEVPDNLTDLDDTPATLGTAGQVLAVNSAGDAVEFVDAATGSASAFTDLTDTPTALGTAGQIVQVDTAGTGLEFADAPSSTVADDSITPAKLADGSDTPTTGQYVAISSTDATQFEYVDAPSGGGTGLDAEGVRDTIAAALTAGANVTITPDDANDTITIASTFTDTNTQRTDQEIIDVVATMPMAGLGTSVVQHSDAGEITGFGVNVSTEFLRDTIASFITEGTDISVTHDDAGNTLTIAYTGTPGTGGTSEEDVRDLIGSTLQAGANITITPDDANDTVTIAATDTGLTQTEVDARITTGYASTAFQQAVNQRIMDEAETGNTQPFPDGKIPEITTDKLADDAVTSDKLGDGSVGPSAIAWDLSQGVPVPTTDEGKLVAISDTGLGYTVFELVDPPSGGLDAEGVRDTIGTALTGGTDISVTPDDANDTITIAYTGTPGTGGTSEEEVRDLIGSTLVEGANVSITVDDDNDTVTIASAYQDTQRTDEEIRDVIAAALTAGTNIQVVPDDANDTITINASHVGEEQVRDWVASFVQATSPITVTHDDAGNTLTVALTGPAASIPTLPTTAGNYALTYASGNYSFTNLAAHAGLSQSEVDARIDLKTANWAETDNSDVVPLPKLDAAAEVPIAVGWNTSSNIFNAGNFTVEGTTQAPVIVPERLSGNAYLAVWVGVPQAADVGDISSDETEGSLFGDILTATNNRPLIRNSRAGTYWFSSLITEPIEWSEARIQVEAAQTFLERVQQIIADNTATPAWYTAPDIPDVADLPSGNGEYVATVSRNGAGDRVIGWGADIRTFLGLTDTPSTFGTAGQALVVNDDENGAVWRTIEASGGSGSNTYVISDTNSNITAVSDPATGLYSGDADSALSFGATFFIDGARLPPSEAIIGVGLAFTVRYSSSAAATWNNDEVIFDVFSQQTRIGSLAMLDTPTSGEVANPIVGSWRGSTYDETADTTNRISRMVFRDTSDNVVDELPYTGDGSLNFRLRQTGSTATTAVWAEAWVEIRKSGGGTSTPTPGGVNGVNIFWGVGQNERVPNNYTDVTGLSRVGGNEGNWALRLTWQDPAGGPNESYFTTDELISLYNSGVANSLPVDQVGTEAANSLPSNHVFGLQQGLYTITIHVEVPDGQDNNRNRIFLMEALTGADDKLLAVSSGAPAQPNDVDQGKSMELRLPYLEVGSTTRYLYALLTTGRIDPPNGGWDINRHLMVERYQT